MVNKVLRVLLSRRLMLDRESARISNHAPLIFTWNCGCISSAVVDASPVKSERMFVLTVVIVVEDLNLFWCFLLCQRLCLLSSVTIH